jgi:glucosylglycerate synthase
LEVDAVSQQTQEKVEQTLSADLIVGIVADIKEDAAGGLFDSLRALPGSPRIAVLKNARPADSAAPKPPTEEKDPQLSVIPWPQQEVAAVGEPVRSISSAYQSAFAVSQKLGARACCVITSTLEAPAWDWICQLVRPLIEDDFDLVAAYYARRRFEGLLNSSIIYPVTRCLYGKRIHNPLGPDLGVSVKLFQKLLDPNGNSRAGASSMHLLSSIAPIALCGNFKVAQVHLPARSYAPIDWMNISSFVVQALGPIFLDMEKHAACWQKTRGSLPIHEFEQPIPISQEEKAELDVGRMVESFRLANRDLREIWGVVLPPATQFELGKLSRLAPDQFCMPDELWARIIYDFALAHRLQTINRDHLLKSMTPLYLAWVASYARELETAGAANVEQRFERLSLAYEASKPYLISRWRWPDRFNP